MKLLKSTLNYSKTFTLWVLVSIVVGAVCGVVGTAFSLTLEAVTHLRLAHDHLVWCMPLAGLIITLIYRALKLPADIGTDEIIRTVRTQEHVSIRLAPAIFVSTALTHLTGGSAGREGAALQLGGAIGIALSKLLRKVDDNHRVFELCGMAAVFSALFGTPLAAAVFVVEIVEIGRINDRALLPCVVAALTARLVAGGLGAPAEAFPLAEGLAQVTGRSLLQAGGVGIACGMVAVLFCYAMRYTGRWARQLIKNDYLRVALGGVLVAGLALLLHTTDYQGGGMEVIHQALAGTVKPEAFLLKILFTALTLGLGFKGGEIVPAFFVGATLGCLVAPMMGMDPGLGAGLGIIAMFCGVTNGVLASMVMSVELFGTEYLPMFAVAATVSFALSGQISLYHAQLFTEPKMGANT